MKVLVVSAHLPFPPRWGFGMRVYQLVRQVAATHEATLLCYAQRGDENVERLRREFPVEVVERRPRSLIAKRREQVLSLTSRAPYDCRTNHSREMQRTIDRLCAEHRFDLIQIESTLLALFDYPEGTPIVIDEHNVDYEVYARMHESEASRPRRAFYRLEQARFEAFERRWWRRAAACVMTSAREAEIVREHAPETATFVVPNAVDVDYFRPEPVALEPRTLVFNGVLDYRPNIDGVNFLVDEVMPLVRRRHPEARLTVVGRGSPPDVEALRARGVEATGEVEDIRPYLQRAEAVVVPIRMGSGTRLKVVEGLAMGKPLVSTSVGCEGVDVLDGKHLLIGDTAEAFADSVSRLFEDTSLAAELGRAGRELMEREYSWASAGARLNAVYDHVVGRTPSERPDRVPV